MKRLSWRMLLAAVLLAGVLTVPASAQYGLDEIEYNVTAWVTTEDILSTSPTEYLAVASARNLASFDILFVAKAGGGLERWQESAGWVQNDNLGAGNAGYTNNVYSSLAGHVADQNQAYGANAAGGVDRIYTQFNLWYSVNIFGAGTLYNAVGMDRNTGAAILYAAPAAGNVQRWSYGTSWTMSGNVVTDGTVYNDVVGDPTMNDSMYGVPTSGGIDRIWYNVSAWWRQVNIVGATETYTTIAADNNAPGGEIILYAGLPDGGVDRWHYNGSSWSSSRIVSGRYTSLSSHDQTVNKFFGTALPPPVPTGTVVVLR